MAATDIFTMRRDAGTGLGHGQDREFFVSGASASSIFVLFRSVLGMMFFATGLGLWLLPGSTDIPEVRIMQMGVTAFFVMIGYALFRGSAPARRPELHIDLVRRSVELSVRDVSGAAISMARYHLDELSDIAVIGTTVVASDTVGNEVINLDLEDKTAALELRDFLIELPPLGKKANLFREAGSFA
ncbi:MAG: hypothetical protein QGI08_14405 [Paracoccaceae bacterium]|jgi:hypothetical protein|nr:hypothetical protein [Paracoccaceae bacterium]MDP7186910.1 hypothetical protein [Paracoccaceae bacterium]